MKQIIYYCDHCGKIINNMTDYVGIELELNAIGMDCDLCKECHDKLVKNISEFLRTKDDENA